MNVRAFDWSKYHGREKPGSTRLRIDQLIKYWPEFDYYKYGEFPDVMVYQKVYIQDDWRFMEDFENLQILDICDPDWLKGEHIKQTLDAVDAATCPTETIAEFLRQLTDKPIRVIPDRHDLDLIPKLKTHTGKLKKAVWFGYQQNAEALKDVMPTLEKRGIELTVISNDNPNWLAEHKYLRYDSDTIQTELAKFDVCILPQGTRPIDRFKSNNKTTLAWLCGLPVIRDLDELEAMMTPAARNKEAQLMYDSARLIYDCKISVQEMKQFIMQLQNTRTNHSPLDKLDGWANDVMDKV